MQHNSISDLPARRRRVYFIPRTPKKISGWVSRYMTALITKFYEMEERQTMEKEVTRPVCVQVPVELFEQFKTYLKQHGMTQKDFVIRCIQQALAEDAGAGEE